MKPIRLSKHALGYIVKRGFTVTEVEETIRESNWKLAEQGRFQCRKNFPFNRDWNGNTYATKQLRPIFIEKDEEILVVTVYTYYF